MLQQISCKFLLIVLMLFVASVTTPANADDNCPAGDVCINVGEGGIAIPNAFKPEKDANDTAYFQFWMPDADDGNEGQRPEWYLYPDMKKVPQPSDPKYLVEVKPLCDHDNLRGPCPMESPIEDVKRAAKRDPSNLDKAQRLLTTTTDTITRVSDVFGGARDDYFIVAGCKKGECNSHFLVHCYSKPMHPPYRVCSGHFEMSLPKVDGAIQFIGFDDQRILSVGQTIDRLVAGWTNNSIFRE